MQLIVEKKSDAETIVSRLKEIKQEEGGVRVSDVNELVGLTGTWRDEYQGWVDLSEITIEEQDTQCTINLPDPFLLVFNK
jgi:hypothetical protein